jgi:hypothetical protein
MSKTKEYARLMRRSLEDNVHEQNTYIKMALDMLSDADNASDKEVLDMTREIVKATFRGEVGTKLAIHIANGVRLQNTRTASDEQGQVPLLPLHIPLPPPRGQVLKVSKQ